MVAEMMTHSVDKITQKRLLGLAIPKKWKMLVYPTALTPQRQLLPQNNLVGHFTGHSLLYTPYSVSHSPLEAGGQGAYPSKFGRVHLDAMLTFTTDWETSSTQHGQECKILKVHGMPLSFSLQIYYSEESLGISEMPQHGTGKTMS